MFVHDVVMNYMAAVGVVGSSGHSNAACKSSRSALLLLEYREVAYCWGSPSYSSSFNFYFSDQLILRRFGVNSVILRSINISV
jgi:hypothetical protein